MRRVLFLLILSGSIVFAQEPILKFERSRIGNVIYEAVSAFDVNNDNTKDIVSGEYWFEGPDFVKAHRICELQAVGDYYDDFADYPMDVNGDGYLDIVSGGWWGETVLWRENPKGQPVEWKNHVIDKCGNVETIRFWDVDRDGKVEVCPNAGGNVVYYKLVVDANGKGTGTFTKHVVKEGGCGHGLGFGDVNGDGRGDFIVPDAWIEGPPDPLKDTWTWHPEFQLGAASIPVLVHDVNEDGKADLISGAAHPYGLAWWEQGPQTTEGVRPWAKHDIDPNRSQYHDLVLVDIDKDGKPEMLTGKRYRAHNEHDPGSFDPVGLYYFNLDGGKFERVTLDYGPADKASGAGIYMWVEDIDGNGWQDILAPGKEGLYLFRNMGQL
jgi:hypothetical protein